jgi:Lar family restriction alleviation protein
MSEALEQLLDCPFCGSPAELSEWAEHDAMRWTAQVKCTKCGAEGPNGYADNRLGCYDAVNDLHKQSAITAWNKRAPKTDSIGSEQNEVLRARKFDLAALTSLRDELIRESEKTDCYTCYREQAAYIARKLTALIDVTQSTDMPPRTQAPTNWSVTDDQLDALWLYRKNIHNGELMPQLRDFARAVLAASSTEPVDIK